MGEADVIPLELDDVRRERRRQPLFGASTGRAPHELERRVRDGGRRDQGGACIGRKHREAVTDERREGPGQRLARLQPDRSAADGAAQLQREQRVPARQLAQPSQPGPRQHQIEPFVHEPVHGAQAERPDSEAP